MDTRTPDKCSVVFTVLKIEKGWAQVQASIVDAQGNNIQVLPIKWLWIGDSYNVILCGSFDPA